MAVDIFGSAVLFEEFEKDRTSSHSFIAQDKSESPNKDAAKHIIFSLGDSDSSSGGGDSGDDIEFENENEGNDDLDDSHVAGQFPDTTCESKHQTFAEGNGETPIKEDSNKTEQSERKKQVKTPTSYQIIHERNKFKQFSSLIDSTRYVPDEESPAIQVLFQNNDFARKYRVHVEQFLTSLIEHEAREKHPRKPEFPIKSSVMTCVDLNNKLPACLRTERMCKAHAILGNAQFHKYFLIDTLGWPMVDLDPGLTDGWYAPVYELNFSEPFPAEEEKMGPAKRNQRPKASCFNCGGEHMIVECPEPKDMRRINENRRNFQSQRSPMQKQGSTRYHKDEQLEDSSKFQPGKMSEDLRHALGISRRELPRYIYKMRELGYPPGWLIHAEKPTSGIALFDKDGKEVLMEGDKTEEGEVKEPVPFEGKVDLEKIIEYPGFTVKLPKDVTDDWRRLGMPPLQEHQLKSTLMSHIKQKSDSMKRKAELEEEAELKKLRTLNKEEDMDLDDDELNQSNSSDFVPPLPVYTPPSKPPLPDGTPPATPGVPSYKYHPTPSNLTPDSSPASTPKHSMSVESAEDISLQDLEDQYKIIKQKLAEDEGDVSLQVIDDVDEEDTSKINTTNESFGSPARNISKEDSMSSIKSFGELGTGSPEHSKMRSPGSTPISFYSDINFTFKGTVSIDKEYGTPIVQRKDSFQALPETSNFTVGITDHIPFENLPNSTGSYLKMKELFDRIKAKISGQKKSKKS